MFGLFKKKSSTYKNISADEFKSMMETHTDAIILDVRSEGEVKSGKLKGAKVINWMSPGFKAAADKLPKDKNLLVYCRSGNRSGSACKVLGDMGFQNVFNLKGGIMSWKYPLSK